MLGESAGRSAHNSPRREARRRFDDAERTKNTPLPDDPSYWGEEEFPNKVRMRESLFEVTMSVIFGIASLMLVLVSKRTDWVGMLAGGVLVMYVVCLSFWAYNMHRRYNR